MSFEIVRMGTFCNVDKRERGSDEFNENKKIPFELIDDLIFLLYVFIQTSLMTF